MAKGKKKGRVRIKQKARIRKKGEGDSIKKAPAKLYRDNSANFKIKIKRKSD